MRALALLILLGPSLADAAPDPVALLARFECHRCHEGTGLPAVPQSRHCVRCHQEILADRFDAPKAVLAQWRTNLRSLRAVPSLEGVGRTLRRDWVRDFLMSPQDLRPHLLASMPRLALSRSEASALALHLVPEQRPGEPPNPSLQGRGRELYREHRCADCHAFTGSGESVRAESPYRALTASGGASDPMALAPDLRFTRARMQPGALIPWLLGPSTLRPATLMPTHSLSKADAAALAAFLWHVPLEDTEHAASMSRLPVLERKVSYAEVERRVFRKVCWHCHSSPDYNQGDGGPGNTGGFGFPPRRLDLASYEGLAAGLIGDQGKRESAFAPTNEGTPRLLAVLLARRAEERGGAISGVRGMPLGLPSLSDEEIQLVESWIAQGRPR